MEAEPFINSYINNHTATTHRVSVYATCNSISVLYYTRCISEWTLTKVLVFLVSGGIAIDALGLTFGGVPFALAGRTSAIDVVLTWGDTVGSAACVTRMQTHTHTCIHIKLRYVQTAHTHKRFETIDLRFETMYMSQILHTPKRLIKPKVWWSISPL